LGRIKSYNPRHGFGFIDCPAAAAQFGRDVFIHKALIGDLVVGDEVNFAVQQSKDGRPQARDIRRPDGSMPGPTPDDVKAQYVAKQDREGGKPGDGEGKPNRRQRRGKGKAKPKVEATKQVDEETTAAPGSPAPAVEANDGYNGGGGGDISSDED